MKMDDYDLLSEIGKGMGGVVYLARDGRNGEFKVWFKVGLTMFRYAGRPLSSIISPKSNFAIRSPFPRFANFGLVFI